MNTNEENRPSTPGAAPLTPTTQASGAAPGATALASDPFAGPLDAPPGRPGPHITLERLLRHKRLALTVFLGFSVPVIAGIWLFYVPMYRAEAAVLVAPRIPLIAFRTDDNGQIPNYFQHLNTEAAKLRDPVVLNRVLERSDVRQTHWYQQRPHFALGGVPSQLDRLRDSLDARAGRDSSYIFVYMECEEAAEAKLIVNAVIKEYENYVAQEFNEDDDVVLRVLEEKLDKLYLDSKTLKNDIANLLENSGLYTENPDALLQQQRLLLDTKESELTDLQHALALANRRLNQARQGPSPDSQPSEDAEDDEASSRSFYAADPEWRRLNEDLKNGELALKLASEHFGEAHPEMVRRHTALEHAREMLAAREAELDSQPPLQPGVLQTAAGNGVTTLVPPLTGQVRVDDLQAQAELLTEEIAQQHEQLKETARKVRELRRQQEDLQRLEDQLAILRQNEVAMKTEQARPPAIKTRLAFEPSQPVNPLRRHMLSALALFAGLALGLGAAYLRASTSRAVYEAAEVQGPAETPFLGHLPWIRDLEAMTPQEEVLQAECIRMVRTALLERVNGRGGSAVMITSAGAGAGKTTVALLLAKSFARCGTRVLLVDADLRNPALSGRCGLGVEPGLVGVLTNLAADVDAIRKNGEENLHILPAGALDKTHDPELLTHEALAAGLARWRARYDLVIFDAPPVMPVADARILARQVDGTVLVVRGGHCQRDEVVEALAMISASGSRLFGTVFAGARHRRGYASYYSSYYSHYYRPEVETTAALDVRDS